MPKYCQCTNGKICAFSKFRRHTKPTLCKYAFECTVEFKSITLAVTKPVHSAFLKENIKSVCQQNINLYEESLYLKNKDFKFNPTKNTVIQIY